MKIYFWLETSLGINIQAFSIFLYLGGGGVWEVFPFELISVLLSLLQYCLAVQSGLERGTVC